MTARVPSPAEWLARFGPDGVAEWMDALEEAFGEGARWAALASWTFWARPEQHAPLGDWTVWVLQAGRGWGKNRTASEWVHQKAWDLPGSHGCLAARTVADVRDTVVKGVSGILATAKPWNPVVYTPSTRELRWANGTTAHTYSSDEPDQFRGPNHHWALADEFATWKAVKAADGGTAWDHLRLGCRLEMDGVAPQIVVATTPRPTREMRALLAERGVVVTRGRQRDNAANLSASYLADMDRKFGGTRLGRQEQEGELLEDVEGSIVSLEMIDEMRLYVVPIGVKMERVGVGVDPSGGGDEQGIVAAGVVQNCPCKKGGHSPHYYVIGDSSGNYSPEGWGSASCRLYYATEADRIFGERNYGGDMVQATIRNVDPNVPYEDVSASRGKHVRAEPILALYEQRRVHHVGNYDKLEDELVRFTPLSWEGVGSPNRADALVWVLTKLAQRAMRRFRVT